MLLTQTTNPWLFKKFLRTAARPSSSWYFRLPHPIAQPTKADVLPLMTEKYIRQTTIDKCKKCKCFHFQLGQSTTSPGTIRALPPLRFYELVHYWGASDLGPKICRLFIFPTTDTHTLKKHNSYWYYKICLGLSRRVFNKLLGRDNARSVGNVGSHYQVASLQSVLFAFSDFEGVCIVLRLHFQVLFILSLVTVHERF